MDAEPQDASPKKSRADADAVMASRRSNDNARQQLQPVDHPSLAAAIAGRRDPCAAEANERDSSMKGAKEAEGSDSETKTPKEPPPSPQSQSRSPLKRRPTSTRLSAETYRSLGIDDDDRKSKQSSFSMGDSSSLYTLDSNDERRLSDKVKKAWRGVTGQKYVDPLEQWMVKHSGGTLREVGASRSPKKSTDKR